MIPEAVVAAVIERAGGYCEACGLPMPDKVDLHHRKLRAQGGQHTAANLVATHHKCHMRIHREPELGYRHGLLVRSFEDPAAVAVRLVPHLDR